MGRSDYDQNQEGMRFRVMVLPFLNDGYSLARWLTGNRADAEDVVQEACLRAFQGFAGFVGHNPRAWFLKVVRNTAYTWLDNKRSAALVLVGDLEATEIKLAEHAGVDCGASATPEAELIAKADATRLEDAISKLPCAFRETFVLRDVHGLDYREIADVTKAPLGTVMSRLARARRLLVAAVATGE
jgi:RNA polymerase sigma-70 factor (ECF subfamily)